MNGISNRGAAPTAEALDQATLSTKLNFPALGLLLALCFWQFFWGLGAPPFYTRGEAREGLVVWQMVKSGNWVLPVINGDYIPYKPPLFHWVGVLASAVAGDVNELTIRFPSALFATLGVILIYIAGSRLWNEKAGRLAAFILATNSEWWEAGTLAQVDMTLTFFLTAALLLFYFIHREGKCGQLQSMALALLLALATLAKGPLGVLLPALIFVVFLGLRRDFAFAKKLHLFSAAAVFLVVAGTWYALAMRQGGAAFFIRQIVEENLGTAAGDYGHHQPYAYFMPVFFLDLAPWSFFAPLIALFLYRQRRQLAERQLLFPLVWLVTVLLFFSLALGKRGIYILPLFPAFALLFGAWWADLYARAPAPDRWLTAAAAYLIAAAVLFVAARMAWAISGAVGRDQRIFLLAKDPAALTALLRFLTPPPAPVWICLTLFGAGSLLIFLPLRQPKWNGIFVGLAVMAAAATLFIKTTYHPAIAAERTLKPFAVRLRQSLDPKARLFFYHAFDYGTIFYARRPIASYAPQAQGLNPPVYLLLWEDEWQRIRHRDDLKIVDISKGRGPAGRHRLVLIESAGNVPNFDSANPPSGDADAIDGKDP